MAQKKHSSFLSTLMPLLLLVAGLGLLLYPTIADFWNSLHQSRAILTYNERVAELDSVEYEALWDAAEKYNASLLERSNMYLMSEEQSILYKSMLDLAGNGIMGYIEIPSLEVSLPIYHGTQDEVLQNGIGHIEWSSLPVGGESTHSVVSGHRGLPSSKLFTNLDQLDIGDEFRLIVLDRTLTYEVDQTLTVEPEDTSALLIKKGEDLCTLVTCTPYGINTHRLLVRGHRVETPEDEKIFRISADAEQVDELIVAAVMAAVLLLIVLPVVSASDHIRMKKRKGKA